MKSYDLTEDDRGLTFGRMVNTDLVLARNNAYRLWKTSMKHNQLSDGLAHFDNYLFIQRLIDPDYAK